MQYMDEYFNIFAKLNNLGLAENRAEIALGILQQIGKERRTEIMSKSAEGNNFKSNMNGPASEKQIYWLKKHGVQVKEGLTKAEASRLIEELKK